MRARTLSAMAAAGALAACTDGRAPLTSGERIADGRDFAEAWFWRPRSLIYTRDATSGDGSQDVWVRELDESEPSIALPNVDLSLHGWPRIFAGDLLVVGPNEKFAYDVDAHLAEYIPAGRVVVSPDGRALARWNENMLATDVVRVGPVQGERDVVGFTTRAADFMGTDVAVLGHRTQDPTGVQVLARLSPTDGSMTVMSSALPPWTPSTMVPAVPSNDPIADACGTLSLQPCPLFRVLGCSDTTPVCPETGERPCAIVFAREVAGTEPAAFAPAIFDVNAGAMIPIGGSISPSDGGFHRSPDGRRVAWTDGSFVHIWDSCARRTFGCEVASPLPAFILSDSWSPDGSALVAGADGASLLVMSAADGGCVSNVTEGWGDVFFSPHGEKMGWINLPSMPPDSTVWIADGRGQSPAPLAGSYVTNAGFSDDVRFVFVERLRDVTVSLGVVDLAAAAPAERPLASSTTYYLTVGARRLLALTHFNSQDQSGRIELFDLALQTSTVLAESVTEVAAAGSVDDAVDIAYVVRSRVPSSSDGLWLATLPPAGAPR